MSADMVRVDGKLHSVALLSAGFVKRPGDMAMFRAGASAADGALERLLEQALSDAFTGPGIRRLVHGPGPCSATPAETLERLMAAIRAGWILAVPMPGGGSGTTRVLLDRAPADLPPMRDALPPQQELCKAVLVEAGKDPVSASALLPQASRVLAAWTLDRNVGPGAAVRAVHEVSHATRRGGVAFVIAAHLVRTVGVLVRQDRTAREEAVAELRAAAALLGWPELLGVLVQMTREFRPRGGVGSTAPPPAPPSRRAAPPPRQAEEAPDDAAQADALREAAQSGVPFCAVCEAAARAAAA
jgi:hypothetical protein